MVRIVRCTDPAALLPRMHAYFVELGYNGLSDAELTAELFEDEDVRGYTIETDVPIGFAFIEKAGATTLLCEMTIWPEHRRNGYAAQAAPLIFALRPGWWELSAMPTGLTFWRTILPGLPGLTQLTEGPAPLPHQSAHFRFHTGAPE